MVQIEQTTKATFSAIELKDAIAMCPLMDELHDRHLKAIKEYENHRNDEKRKERWDYNDQCRIKELAIKTIENQLFVLYKLGFQPSVDMTYQSYFEV